MPEPDELVAGLAFLAKHLELPLGLPHVEHFHLLPPNVAQRGGAEVPLQEISSSLASHIRYEDKLFLVALTSLPRGTPARIELNSAERDVLVEVDSDAVCYPEVVTASLAHEITHEYLFSHGAYAESACELNREALTDVGSVLLGFGKLMLRGSEVVKKHMESTEVLRAGYLSRSEFALLFEIVSTARNVPRAEREARLSKEIRQELHRCRLRFRRYLTPRAYGPSAKDAARDLSQQIASLQGKLATIKREMEHLSALSVPGILQRVRALHKRMHGLQQQAEGLESESEPRSIGYLGLADQLTDTVSDLRAKQSLMQDIASKTRDIVGLLKEWEFQQSTDERFEEGIDCCGSCGTKLRLPQGRGRVKCPKCGYSSVVDTRGRLTAEETKCPGLVDALWSKLLGSSSADH